jgi:hypothetical protein
MIVFFFLGNDFLNADSSRLESKEEILVPTEIGKNLVSAEEGIASSYCDTILLSEYLNLCSSRILPPREEQTPPDSFPLDKLENSEIEPGEKKVKHPSDGTSNGICDASALDLKIVEVKVNGEHDKNLELEQKVNNGPDDSHNFVSDTRALVPETVNIEEHNENDENLNLGVILKRKPSSLTEHIEEDTSSVKEVKSILKQIREEIVKAEPNLGAVPETDHEADCSVSDETGMKLLSEPKVVEERKNEAGENGSGTCAREVAPDSRWKRLLPLSDSIASNLKILRKQNKHSESSSSSSSDFD